MPSSRHHGSKRDASHDCFVWQQCAGFSVFVDHRTMADGTLEWRTRLYHDESSETTTVVGVAISAWAPWITGHLPVNGTTPKIGRTEQSHDGKELPPRTDIDE